MSPASVSDGCGEFTGRMQLCSSAYEAGKHATVAGTEAEAAGHLSSRWWLTSPRDHKAPQVILNVPLIVDFGHDDIVVWRAWLAAIAQGAAVRIRRCR